MLTYLKPKSVLLVVLLTLLIICLAIDLPRNYPEGEHTAIVIFTITTAGVCLLFIPFYLILVLTKRLLKYPKDFDPISYFQVALGFWGVFYICILLTDVFRNPPLNFNNTVTFLATTLMTSVIWLPVSLFKLWQHRSQPEFIAETELILPPEITPQTPMEEELLINSGFEQQPQIIQKSTCPPFTTEQPASPNPWDSQPQPSTPKSNNQASMALLNPELNVGPLINDEQTLFISYARLNSSAITYSTHQLVLTNWRFIFIEENQSKQFYLSEITHYYKTEQALQVETTHANYTFFLEPSELNNIYNLLAKTL